MEPGARLLQPIILQRVCKKVLELPENASCDMREMNNDDEEAIVEYTNEISQELFDLLFDNNLPMGSGGQNTLLRKVFDLLYEGARADKTLTIYGNEYNAEESVFDALFEIEAIHEGDEKYETAEYKSFINELMALLFFMGTSPENRQAILERFGRRGQTMNAKEMILYNAFVDVRNRLSRSNEKARMVFQALQREGENAKWKSRFPSDVEEKVISFLKPRGGLRRIRSLRRIRTAHKRNTLKGKKGAKIRKVAKKRQTKKNHN